MAVNLWRFASPQVFYPLAGKMVPWFLAAAVILTGTGLYVGFFVAPTDFQQGEAYRIIFLHVAAAWMSMFIYLVMAFWCAVGLIMNTRLSFMMALGLAPTGALMTFVALWSGSLWGKPTWGTWWVWDARLTSELILLFLYIGFLSLHAAIDDVRRADKAASLLALVGAVNVPIIYFSVKWWNTLHQGASVSLTRAPSMARAMLLGMLLVALGAWMYSIAASLMRVRSLILERESDSDWVKALGEAGMNWGGPEQFFAMGGYGLYVWGSYGVAALVVAAELWVLVRRRRTLLRRLGRSIEPTDSR